MVSPYFTAVCLQRKDAQGPRIGLTVPRALGKAVIRNRLKRRIREAARRQLNRLPAQWEIVLHPRRAALGADFRDLERQMERVFRRCGG